MSTRRIKDRSAGDGVAAVSKPSTLRSTRSVTPLSASRKFPSLDNTTAKISSSAEKENTHRRSTSRGSNPNPTQKPQIRPVPRVDKASLAEARDRRSTSSVPRGRSSSPSEFNRVFLDAQKTRRVSVDRVVKDPTREVKGYRDSSVKSSERLNSGSNLSRVVGNSEKVRTSTTSSVVNSSGKVGFEVSESELSVQSGKVSILKDGVSGDSKKESECSGNKYPSRLHEKLAFLEGKVKRIASDIKKTKEMLDMNNPDASKVILSDIQDKISGIEKAMVHVTGADEKGLLLKNNDSDSKCNEDKKLDMGDELVHVDKCEKLDMVDEGKSLIKGLNSEELEARLFPHHKLLRNRMKESSSESCGGSEKQLTVEDKVLSPVDETVIEVEFLASLSKKETSKGEIKCVEVHETHGGPSAGNGVKNNTSSTLDQKGDIDLMLASDEKLEEFDDQQNSQEDFVGEETDGAFNYSLNEIGNKTAVAGWFVSEGEAVLLAHDDGSCSYYDIANCEGKAVYMPPPEVSPNIWRDCWVIRAPGSDGCSGRFVVAASAGNTIDSGFCSWDFYTKEVKAFQVENGTSSSRTALRALPNNIVQRRNSATGMLSAEARQWWYKPCGPLVISTASSQRSVKVFDVRDGEQIMKWDVQKSVLAMEYSSPLQWRNRGKVVLAEAESISLWDVNSLTPQALLSVPTGGRKMTALHVSNTDAELGGGVRKRASSSEAEGNDGVFCTADSINILDFRQPSGVGLRISKHGLHVQSVFSRGDSVFLGCTSSSSLGKKHSSSSLQQFSLRRQGLLSTYDLPESNTHPHHSAITQVWGNSDFVMGVSGLGLHVFDALKDDALRVLNMDYSNAQRLREVIGPDDLYWPSFDYLGSRALLISRDRPAMWRHLIA